MRRQLFRLFLALFAFLPALTATAQSQACDTSETRTIVVQNETITWPRDLAAGEALPIRPAANDRDIRGGTLTVASAWPSAGLGQVSVSSDGQTIFFVPVSRDYPVGGGSIGYTVTSTSGGSANGTITFTAGAIEAEPDFSFTCQAGLCYFTAIPADPVDIRSFDWTFAEKPSCNKSEWRGRVTQCSFPAPPSGSTTASMQVTLRINYLSGRQRTRTRTVSWTVERPKLEWSWYTEGSGDRFGLSVDVALSCPTCITCGDPIDQLTWLWGDEDPANPVEQPIYTQPCSGGSLSYPPIIGHTYRKPGIYIAKAIIRRGPTGTPFYYPAAANGEPAGLRIEVRNTPPEIAVKTRVIPSRPDEVEITTTITDDVALHPPADPVLRDALAPTRVEWDFGDGTDETSAGPFTLENSGPLILNRNHIYKKKGRYAITVRATDIHGETSTYTSPEVVIDHERPKAAFTLSCTGLQCRFDASASITADFTPEKYSWLFDGVLQAATTSATTTFTFAAPGTHTATLYVYSAARGTSDGVTRKVMVTNEVPARLSYYAPTVPCRMYDSRTSGVRLESGVNYTLAVPSAAPCRVPADAKALHVNVVALDPTAPGNLALWKGGTRPAATALNFTPDSSPRANNVVVAMANGSFILSPTLFPATAGALAETHVVIDVIGYYSDVATGASCGTGNGWCGPLLFTPVAQCRAIDTRFTPPRLEIDVARFFPIRNQCGVPGNARAVTMNATVFQPANNGNILVTDGYTGSSSGCLSCAEDVSSLNMRAGRTQTNGVISRTGTLTDGRDVVAWARFAPTDLIADVTGYFRTAAAAPGAYGFHAVPPCRLVDTRDAEYGQPALTNAEPQAIQAAGQCGIPADAKAVVVNAAVVRPPANGYLRLYRAGTTEPVSSVLNFRAGDILANTTIVELDRGALPSFAAQVMLLSNDAVATSDFIVDVFGYYR